MQPLLTDGPDARDEASRYCIEHRFRGLGRALKVPRRDLERLNIPFRNGQHVREVPEWYPWMNVDRDALIERDEAYGAASCKPQDVIAHPNAEVAAPGHLRVNGEPSIDKDI